ncbi:hypothetical protein ACIA8O_04875 [Kitasatospora sp. NPDC051853]|uniref:hypothetical protein n=1 Tax=Kitasatospora sp. NPDC051853 TaxID=3364058 RepID=UPI00378BBA2A
MGYDIHLTLRANWWDDEGEDISAPEWRAVVEADPELVMIPSPQDWAGDVEVVLGEGQSDRWPLWWRDGRISTKNPGDAVILKMCQVAKLLHARVQGDDGERYEASVSGATERLVVVPWGP